MQEKILNIIEKNSKIDTKELSVLVGEDEEAVKKNISDLEQKHVI
ncbi:MAG: winged helix-turn-helix domain-containing protein, partial [Lachnospiraceae bacterium]|nr:winged helix-turn-helix domain-containing protein [Lachnospiraceae bacterium]